MSSRRAFLKQSSLAAGGVLLSSTSFGNILIGKKPKVIIIGAGLAGLSAANILLQKNIDFTILEARNRIGGRVFSHTIDERENLVVELGAEWVGNSHTKIRELCGEFNLELQNNQFDSHLIYQGKYYKDNEWNYSEEWQKKFKSILSDFRNFSEKDKRKLDKTDWWRFLVNNGCEGRDLDIRELLDSTDFGESIRNVSAFAALAEYAESSEKNEMDLKIRGGNSMLPKKIGEKIGMDKILLERRVQRIVQDKKGGVKVYCKGGEEFSADKLICTAPAFAVRKIKWEPELSLEYEDALDELQYARINKNPLLFSERFWKAENFDMVTDQTLHYFYHATKNQASKKGVLISYTIGEKAAVIANQTDEWKSGAVFHTLQPYFGNIRNLLEKQTNYYWGKDEFSHGAYAVYDSNQWFRLRPILKSSHIHTYFAGEHLADWQGFMEGAIITGEEAAGRI